MTASDQRQQDWEPPAGFHRVDSALDGVVVYAPAPEEDDASHARKAFKCPRCGAPIAYDEKAGSLSCPYCGHQEASGQAAVGTGAEAQEFTLEALAAFEQGWGVERKELHCETCGADLAVTEGAIAAECPFCASPHVNLRESTHSAMRPRFVVPFSVDRDQVGRAATAWLGKGWMFPADLARMASIDRFTGVYLPWWTFTARLESSWEAEVGYEETERYYDFNSGQWKTRTVIKWRWETGAVELDLSDLLVSGTDKLPLLERVDDFDLGALVPYAPEFLAGWQAHDFDVALPAAWEQGKAAMREQARVACRNDIGSSHVRNFSMTADFRDETWRYVLLPAYVSSYRFGGRVYRVLVNGQTGTIDGQKPVAWWKIWLVIAAMFTPSIVLGVVGLPLLLLGGIGVFPLALAFLCLVGAGVGAWWLHGRAVASEAA